MTASGDDRVVRAERSHEGRTATGEVRLRETASEGHLAELAAARAWLQLAEDRLGHEPDAAIACARAGLLELGPDYAPDEVEDDTQLKVLAAEDRIEQGHAADGAAMLVDMLRSRVRLYQERHAEEIED